MANLKLISIFCVAIAAIEGANLLNRPRPGVPVFGSFLPTLTGWGWAPSTPPPIPETTTTPGWSPPPETTPGWSPPPETTPGWSPPPETTPGWSPPPETTPGWSPPPETTPGWSPPPETTTTPPPATTPGWSPPETTTAPPPPETTPGWSPPPETTPGWSPPPETTPGWAPPVVTPGWAPPAPGWASPAGPIVIEMAGENIAQGAGEAGASHGMSISVSGDASNPAVLSIQTGSSSSLGQGAGIQQISNINSAGESDTFHGIDGYNYGDSGEYYGASVSGNNVDTTSGGASFVVGQGIIGQGGYTINSNPNAPGWRPSL